MLVTDQQTRSIVDSRGPFLADNLLTFGMQTLCKLLLCFSSCLEPNDELWIGLNDLKIQMYFEWSDGTPVTFTKWLRGEPSHENNRQEDCVVMKGKVRQL